MAAAIICAGALTSCGGSSSSSSDSAKTEQSSLNPIEKKMMESFEKEVTKLNSEMPINLEDGLKMTKVSMEDGYLIYTCTYPADAEFEVVDDPATKKQIIQSIGSPTLRRLKKLNIGIKYVYIKEGTSKEDQIVITPEEL